jgi:hypothetical protein
MSLIQKTAALTVRLPDADEDITGKDARAKETDGGTVRGNGEQQIGRTYEAWRQSSTLRLKV